MMIELVGMKEPLYNNYISCSVCETIIKLITQQLN
jgi:hypothetical protein